ncbi:MAG: ribosome assembly cofactor RimP [Lachnospiraceae bacterium]|uniref:ribosome assembly cofactor RimP n=1 Tax=uncultured Muribaculum sp. TaxID=1918613 RepID=UPI002595B3BC|nr:ribosome assembly cofactor RimP [uncultured Muribaculum sp.]MCM1092656.1 ribosome assembly cofactor RimP [Lachnospiraceae bacterium]
MIDKQKLTDTINEAIKDTPLFLVDVTVTPDNNITVEVDSMESVDIDECVKLTRDIEAVFDRDVEDYQLEVGSAGLTSPFKVKEQYVKNIGNQVEVLTRDGRKFKGTLTAVGDDDFTVAVTKKVKEEGKKRPVEVEEPVVTKVADTKTVKYLIDFK